MPAAARAAARAAQERSVRGSEACVGAKRAWERSVHGSEACVGAQCSQRWARAHERRRRKEHGRRQVVALREATEVDDGIEEMAIRRCACSVGVDREEKGGEAKDRAEQHRQGDFVDVCGGRGTRTEREAEARARRGRDVGEAWARRGRGVGEAWARRRSPECYVDFVRPRERVHCV